MGVIIIVYLIIVAGAIWYNKANQKSLSNMLLEDSKDRGFETFYFLINMDLLHDTHKGIVESELNLISILSFKDYSEKEEGKRYLSNKLGQSQIEIDIYDLDSIMEEDGFETRFDDSEEPLIIYDNRPEEEYIIRQDTMRSLVPVYDPIQKRYLIGFIRVTTFQTAN